MQHAGSRPALLCGTLLVALALAPGLAAVAAPPAAPSIGEGSAPSAEARAVLARTKDALVRLRVTHIATGALASSGTGFVATPDGLVLTNYHLISKIALAPGDHALELEHADGSRTTPRLVAIDVADDLAVLATGRSGQPFLPVPDAWTLERRRGFAMGYPGDLDAAIVEGTYSFATTERALRLDFSGAIEPGMSGGPAVTRDGEVFGVNVARRAGDRRVRNLVPGNFAAWLLTRAASVKEPPADFRKEVVAQVSARLRDTLFEPGVASTTAMGHYIVPDVQAAYARCEDVPPKFAWDAFPRSTRTCQTRNGLFVDDDLQTGAFLFRHERFEKGTLPTAAFADRMERVFATGLPRPEAQGGEAFTAFRCHDGFIRRPGGALRVALCARAYRKLAGLYQFHLRALTVESSSSALLTTLTLSGLSFKDGQHLAVRYLEEISWAK